MNNNVQILLRIVFGQFLVREFLVSHVFHCYYRSAKQAAVMIFFAAWFLGARGGAQAVERCDVRMDGLECREVGGLIGLS
jgi:hypothetical protein